MTEYNKFTLICHLTKKIVSFFSLRLKVSICRTIGYKNICWFYLFIVEGDKKKQS